MTVDVKVIVEDEWLNFPNVKMKALSQNELALLDLLCEPCPPTQCCVSQGATERHQQHKELP